MPILYVTDGPWGIGTGAPHTASQADNNFYDLSVRIDYLEENPPMPVNISNIQVEGSQMMIYMDNGDQYGPFTLPIATFEYRGEYVPTAMYYELDVITVLGHGVYFVLVDHVAPDPFNEDLLVDGQPAYRKIYGDDSYVYHMGCFIPGKPGLGIPDGKRIWSHLFALDVYVLADMPETLFALETAPTSELVFQIRKNNAAIGSVTFAAGATTDFTVDFAATTQFVPFDRLSLMKPGAVDATALELTATFVGRRGTAA
jgi:hypothetical protein